mgnify:CR=1 FL=1
MVYNVAGIAHVKAAKGDEPLYYAVNRDMVIEIAKAAKAAGVKQFIHMSSMIVNKEVKTLAGKQIHKDTIPEPNGFYGDSKLQGESGIRALADGSFKVFIMRPPMIYGPVGAWACLTSAVRQDALDTQRKGWKISVA